MKKVRVLSTHCGIPHGAILTVVDETDTEYIGQWWYCKTTFLEVEIAKELCDEVNTKLRPAS